MDALKVFQTDAADEGVKPFFYDAVQFDGEPVITPQGFMKIRGRLTSVGVFLYRDPRTGKTIRRFRSPAEVFKPESMQTLHLAPLTSPHPPKMVTPENVREYRVGIGADNVAKAGSKYIEADVVVEDAAILKAVKEKGLRQISCGYEAFIDPTPGVWKDPDTGIEYEYDDQQVQIVYNHVALVPNGRQGPNVSLMMDAAQLVYLQDGMDIDDPAAAGKHTEAAMKKVKVKLADGREIELMVDEASASALEQLGEAFNALHAKAHELTGQLNDMRGNFDRLKGEHDALKASSAKAQKDAEDVIKQHDTAMETAVASRMEVLAVAAQVVDAAELPSLPKCKTDLEVMRKAILADDKSAQLDGKTEDYIRGRFDVLAARIKGARQQADALGSYLTSLRGVQADGGRGEEAPDKAKDARSKMRDKLENKWKGEKAEDKGSKDGKAKDGCK